ncbi:uncharacterized protein LOC125034294 [Penaeus chinensis]|uniref:uncharacterized protein LOC125034294 n=1 Tax=Penaeus chinensis TaxID=139456 RepID=UPI001FB78C5B|nr:uncharacterized protein LOC125034294 [Penaeus chinensis]XP_047482010.1 uncharacterized protein LOC125034294 [Penaeus chinensis]
MDQDTPVSLASPSEGKPAIQSPQRKNKDDLNNCGSNTTSNNGQDLFGTDTATSKIAIINSGVNGVSPAVTSLSPVLLPSNSFLSWKDTHGIARKVKVIRIEQQSNASCTLPTAKVICTPTNLPQDLGSTSSATIMTPVATPGNSVRTSIITEGKPLMEEDGVANPLEQEMELSGEDQDNSSTKTISDLGESHDLGCNVSANVSAIPTTTCTTKEGANEVDIHSSPVECEVSFSGEGETDHNIQPESKSKKIVMKKTKNSNLSKTLTFGHMRQERQVHPCHLCGSLLFRGTPVHSVDLHQPLPLSSLLPSILLASLGMSCPLPRSNGVKLCQRCYDLLMEGDATYKKLQVVTERMREAWPAYILESKSLDNTLKGGVIATMPVSNEPIRPTTPPSLSTSRKYVPILPKAEQLSEEPLETSKRSRSKTLKSGTKKKPQPEEGNSHKLCICGLCGMDFYGEQDWCLHMAAVHHVQPRWLWYNLQATLKMQIGKELERPDPLPQQDYTDGRKIRKCHACGKTFSERHELVQHLREFHNMVVDDEFLASISGETTEQPQEPQPVAAVQIKTEVMWDQHDMDSQIWQPENDHTWQQEDHMKQSENSEAWQTGDDHTWQADEQVGNTCSYEDARARLLAEEELTLSKGNTRERSAEEATTSTIQNRVEEPRPSRGARWWCRACGQAFNSLGALHRHKQQNHPGMLRVASRTPKVESLKETTGDAGMACEEEERHLSLKCIVCGLNVEGKKNLKRHMEAEHEGSVVILEGDGCGGIINHRLNLTAAPEAEGDSEERQQVINQNLGQGKSKSKMSCRACGAAFSNLVTLAKHQHEHHKEMVDEGGGPVGSVGIMMLECEVCERRMHGLSALRLHMTKVHHWPHKTGRQHRCKLCLYQGRTRRQLENHMRVKHGMDIMPHVECKLCGKSYTAGYLNRHVANMHENKKGFACEFCGMKFNDNSSLKSHIYFEHANNRWKCEPCKLAFQKYHQLRQHNYYVHSTKVHTCNYCGKTYKRKSDHTEHIKRKHMEKIPTQCPKCPNSYLDRKKLRTHLMRKHGVPWEDTISRRFARIQQESNCLRARPGVIHPDSSSAISKNSKNLRTLTREDPEAQQRGDSADPSDGIHHYAHEEDGEGGRGGGGGGEEGAGVEVVEAVGSSHVEALAEEAGYNIVEVTEAPGDLHAMGDISYIILQAGEH